MQPTVNVVIPDENKALEDFANSLPANQPTATGTGPTPNFNFASDKPVVNPVTTEAANISDRESNVIDNAVVSDTSEVNNEQGALKNINLAQGDDPSREAIDLLDVELEKLGRDLQFQRQAIHSSFDALKSDTKTSQKSETGTTSVGLAEAGGFLGFSGSGTGVLLNLAKSHRSELADLAAKRQSAIAAARKASSDRRFDLVRLKAQELSDIDQEVYQRQQDYFQNQLALQQDERQGTQQQIDQARDAQADARENFGFILETFKGLTKEDITEENRSFIEKTAREAGLPVSAVYKQIQEAGVSGIPEDERKKVLDLIMSASKGGAPADSLQAISGAGSLAEAASIAQPFIRDKQTGGPKIHTSGSLKYTDSDVAFIATNLKNSYVNTDGSTASDYAHPQAYLEAYQQWQIEEGDPVDFEERFPPELYIAATDVDSAPIIVKEMYERAGRTKDSLLKEVDDGNGSGLSQQDIDELAESDV